MKRRFLFVIFIFFEFAIYAVQVKFEFSDSLQQESNVSDELYIGYGSKVTNVELQENYEIKKIVIEGATFIKDFSFILNCKGLECLVMNDMKFEKLDFIYKCINLRIMAFDSCQIYDLPDFRQYDSLEYLAFTNCTVYNEKRLIKCTKRIKFINLINSDISDKSLAKLKRKGVYLFSEDLKNDFPYREYIR